LLIAVLFSFSPGLSAEELGVTVAFNGEDTVDSEFPVLFSGGKVIPLDKVLPPEGDEDDSIEGVEFFPSVALELSFPDCVGFPASAAVVELF